VFGPESMNDFQINPPPIPAVFEAGGVLELEDVGEAEDGDEDCVLLLLLGAAEDAELPEEPEDEEKLLVVLDEEE